MLPSEREAEEYIRRQIERLPARIAVRMERLRRAPRLVRLPVAIVMILGGFAWFLPVVGFWMLPLGLALFADEIPVAQRLAAGAGMAVSWLLRRIRGGGGPPP